MTESTLQFPENYNALSIHQRITFKGMIADRRYRPGFNDVMHEEFDIIKCLAIVSNYKYAIDIAFIKWNNM